METKQFVVEGLSNSVQGYDSGLVWNGFAVPFFTFNQVRDILNELNIKFSVQSDKFVIEDPYYPNQPEILEPNNEGFYALGGYSWCWSVSK